jgi:hypothetical protein
MSLQTWLKSNTHYSRNLVHSAVEGAHSGEGEFLHGEPLAPFLNESALKAVGPAVIGAFLGVLSTYSRNERKPTKTIALGLLGCTVGFGVAFVWENRRLGASVARAAWKKVGDTRDAHWLEENPIDYA